MSATRKEPAKPRSQRQQMQALEAEQIIEAPALQPQRPMTQPRQQSHFGKSWQAWRTTRGLRAPGT